MQGTVEPKSISIRLLEEHRRIEQTLESVLAACAAGNKGAVASLWAELEARLLTHFEIEEQTLISALFVSSPRDARGIVTEHKHIRTRLSELRADVASGALTLGAGRGFLHELAAHAQREEAVLYQWADQNLDPSAQTSLGARLTSCDPLSQHERRTPDKAPISR